MSDRALKAGLAQYRRHWNKNPKTLDDPVEDAIKRALLIERQAKDGKASDRLCSAICLAARWLCSYVGVGGRSVR